MLGAEMRNRYMAKNKLLDSNIYRKEEIFIRATNTNRTIESAISQMLGLFPQGGELIESNQSTKAMPKLKVAKSVIE